MEVTNTSAQFSYRWWFSQNVSFQSLSALVMNYTTTSTEPIILQLSSSISASSSTALSRITITAIARPRHFSWAFLSKQQIDLHTSTEKMLQKALSERCFSLGFPCWKAAHCKTTSWGSLCLASVSLLNLCLLPMFFQTSAFRCAILAPLGRAIIPIGCNGAWISPY